MLHAVPGLDKVFGELLVNAGDGPTLIINRDTANALLIGSEVAVGRYGQTIGAPVSVIDPLGSMAVDGTETLFGQGVQSSGTITIDVKRGATVWAPPASLVISQLVASSLPGLIATAVQSAGVPPIDIPAATKIVINQDVAAGGTFASGHITMSKYQSWSCIMHADNIHNNADTIPYMRVTFAWSLASDNFDPVHVEDWVIPVTPFTFNFNYKNYGSGPCISDTLDITVTSYDTVINAFTLGLFGSYRTRSRSVFRGQYNWLGGGGVNEPAGLGTDAILASVSASSLASGGATSAQLINLWHGKASLYVQSTDAAIDDVEVHIQPQPASILTNSPDIVLTMDGSGTFSRLGDIELPRRVCTIFLMNNGITTIPTIKANLIMAGETE